MKRLLRGRGAFGNTDKRIWLGEGLDKSSGFLQHGGAWVAELHWAVKP